KPMKNLQIGRVKALELAEFTGADEFAIHPILQTLAISTQKELILVENDEVLSKINWENERRGVRVVSLSFRTDSSQIIAVLADGRALVVDDGEVMELEVCDIQDETTTTAEWSADEQMLALADNFNLYLADSSLVPYVERPLHVSSDNLKSTPVNVGWGSESTQFRGSAGKLKVNNF
uniref:ELP1 first N-terminal beta-propeller domain-containing protein n=1 Tax=Caenorhabditis japonica TaxID=281687 RepID=A0A8R1ICB6_CAEJA